jgi:hypothetical protein
VGSVEVEQEVEEEGAEVEEVTSDNKIKDHLHSSYLMAPFCIDVKISL